MISRALSVIIIVLSLITFTYSAHSGPPEVIVTIKPIHSLVVSIMKGVATPKLLMQGVASPHSYALRPSDAAILERAQVIFRVSPNLEIFLNRILTNLSKNATIIDLEKAPGLDLLPIREAFHDDQHNDHAHRKDEAALDMHFWLDPRIAIKLTDYIASRLSEVDPENASIYRENTKNLHQRLQNLHVELERILVDAKGKPFIVFHDVMQYFEKPYQLSIAGAVTLSPERQPGGRRVTQIRSKIQNLKAVCLLVEPQFTPKLLTVLVEGTQAKVGIFDEIGVETEAGENHYFNFLLKNAENIAKCTSVPN